MPKLKKSQKKKSAELSFFARVRVSKVIVLSSDSIERSTKTSCYEDLRKQLEEKIDSLSEALCSSDPEGMYLIEFGIYNEGPSGKEVQLLSGEQLLVDSQGFLNEEETKALTELKEMGAV